MIFNSLVLVGYVTGPVAGMGVHEYIRATCDPFITPRTFLVAFLTFTDLYRYADEHAYVSVLVRSAQTYTVIVVQYETPMCFSQAMLRSYGAFRRGPISPLRSSKRCIALDAYSPSRTASYCVRVSYRPTLIV